MANNVIPALRFLFRRDLLKLRQELVSYMDEDRIWVVEKKISNSAGNLSLHLVGNLNTYIGSELGGIKYIRNRELEFSQKGIPKDELVKRVEETMNIVDSTLANISDEVLDSEYPQIVFAEKMKTSFFLMHLATHLGYHLGQINYHRRILDVKKSNSFGNVYPRAFC